MAEISKLQFEILRNLYKKDIDKYLSVTIQPDSYVLEEKDGIMRIRELVFNIDQLVELDFVSTNSKYYVEPDNMSFEYMNNAVEIIDSRINISPLGIQYMEQLGKGIARSSVKAKKHFSEKLLLITHIK